MQKGIAYSTWQYIAVLLSSGLGASRNLLLGRSVGRLVCQKNVKNCQKRVLKSISVCIRVEKHKGRGGEEEEEEREEEEGEKEEEDKDEETYKK